MFEKKKMLSALHYYVYCVLKKIMLIHEKNNCGAINYLRSNNLHTAHYIVTTVDLYILSHAYDICKLAFIYL